MLIGQQYNKKYVDMLAKSKLIPRFLIITGEKGSGKKLMAGYIARYGVKGYTVVCENGVDAVRQAVENSYKCSTPTTYIFKDADKMSAQAKNALLKVTEEPPKQAYFIMTIESMNNTLETLKSRAAEFMMEHYTKKDLRHFTDDEVILEIATNPGQVIQLQQLNVNEFINFCQKVVDNIGTVTGVNALKIANSFKFKEDQEGYDPILFFNTLMYLYRKHVENATRDIHKSSDSIYVCSKFKSEFNISGLKKDATFDMFLLALREIWRDKQ